MGPTPSSIFEQPISHDVERPQVNHTVSCKYFVSHQLSICCRMPVLRLSNVITVTLAVRQVDLLHCHHQRNMWLLSPLPTKINSKKHYSQVGCYDHAQLRVLSSYSGRIAAL